MYVTYSVGLTRVAVSLDPGQESTAGPGATLAWAWGSCARGWKRPPCRSRWPLAGGAGTTRALAGQEQANNAAKPIPHLPLLGALLFYYRKLCLIVTSTGKKKKGHQYIQLIASSSANILGLLISIPFVKFRRKKKEISVNAFAEMGHCLHTLLMVRTCGQQAGCSAE